MSDAVALAAIVILLFPMGYFFLASPAFLLVKLDIPEVARLLRGMFNAHFLMLSIAGVIGTIAFVVTGHLAFAIVTGLIAAFAVWARRRFLQEWDAQLDARDAGDAGAVRRLRRLHWGGMLCNAIQLAVIVGSIPYVAATSSLGRVITNAQTSAFGGLSRNFLLNQSIAGFDPQATLAVTNGNALRGGFWPLSKSSFEPLRCPEV